MTQSGVWDGAASRRPVIAAQSIVMQQLLNRPVIAVQAIMLQHNPTDRHCRAGDYAAITPPTVIAAQAAIQPPDYLCA